MSEPSTISVGLVSHTNAGKTTLARTLLRRDIGEIADRPRDEIAERHVRSRPQVTWLALWTTGFGDSMRLYRAVPDNPPRLGAHAEWGQHTDAHLGGQRSFARARECDVVLTS